MPDQIPFEMAAIAVSALVTGIIALSAVISVMFGRLMGLAKSVTENVATSNAVMTSLISDMKVLVDGVNDNHKRQDDRHIKFESDMGTRLASIEAKINSRR